MPRTRPKPGRKALQKASRRAKPRRSKTRLTLSLDESTVRFLHRRRAEGHAASLSAAVEDLVAASRRQAERDELEAQTKAYYDSLTSNEIAEDRAWGEFATRQFMKIEGRE